MIISIIYINIIIYGRLRIGFVFVTPVPKEEFYLEIPGVEQPLVGIIKYTNNKLLSYGIDVGDRGFFRPDAEYAVMLEGEKVYRVSSDWITMKI